MRPRGSLFQRHSSIILVIIITVAIVIAIVIINVAMAIIALPAQDGNQCPVNPDQKVKFVYQKAAEDGSEQGPRID